MKELGLLRRAFRRMEVGLMRCIERHSSHLGLSSSSFRSLRCIASFHYRRESSWIDIKGTVEKLLDRLIDRDRIETPTIGDQHTYNTFDVLMRIIDRTLHPSPLKDIAIV